jgi:hypothetical protein
MWLNFYDAHQHERKKNINYRVISVQAFLHSEQIKIKFNYEDLRTKGVH